MNKAIIIILIALMVIPMVNAIKRGPDYEITNQGNVYTYSTGGDIVNVPNCNKNDFEPFNETITASIYNGKITIKYCDYELNLTPYIIKNGLKVTLESYLLASGKTLTNETQLKLASWLTKGRADYEWFHAMDTRFADKFGFDISDETCSIQQQKITCGNGIVIDFQKAIMQGLTTTISKDNITFSGDISYIDPTVYYEQVNATTGLDTYVNSNNPTTNYGTDQQLRCGFYITEYTCLVKINMTKVPSTATIHMINYTTWGAQLPPNGINITFLNVTSRWNETVVTWNLRPTFGTILNTTKATDDAWLLLNVPNTTAQSWLVNDTLNYGFAINGTLAVSGNNYFQASDYSNASLRPRITVVYTDGDITSPVITIQTPVNNTRYTYRNISLNYTISEANLDKCWYQNMSGAQNITLTSCANTTIWVTDGNWNITVYANDTSNNLGLSKHTFYVDTAIPAALINSPINASTYRTYNISLNYTALDTKRDSCWWQNISGKQNITLASCGNVTFVAREGFWNITLFVNDTSGNLNRSQPVYFRINDTTFPVVSVQSPPNNTIYTTNNISLNYTVIEYNIDKCWYQNYSSKQNISLTNCANVTLSDIPNGIWNITVFANDTAQNTNKSSIIMFNISRPTTSTPVYPSAGKLMIWDSALNGTSFAYMSKEGDLTIKALNLTSNMGVACITANGSSIGTCNTINATGNVWVRGCVIYNGGTLGSCV